KVKVVRETIKISEHRCTGECFRPTRAGVPKGMRRVNLGHVYVSPNGTVYSNMDGDWLPVEGITFGSTSDGRLLRILQPAVQIHIHSPGGRTIAKASTYRNLKADESYLAQEVARKLKRDGHSLRDAQNYLRAEARKVIPPAPKRRSLPKGSGRGAPGVPRSALGSRILDLMAKGKPEHKTLREVLEWRRDKGLPIA